MRVAFISSTHDLRPLATAISSQLPWVCQAWPGDDLSEAEAAVCWRPPAGLYAQMPSLRLVHSVAAGVDNLLEGQTIGDIAICRIVDPSQSVGMSEYVHWAVAWFHRSFDQVLRQQREGRWQRHRCKPAAEFRVGVMGLGHLGRAVATRLRDSGFDVAGWSRTGRPLSGVRTFAGPDALPGFLACCDVLVCVLPLTDATRGLLARPLFEMLPVSAGLVHVGRGEQLVESDLLAALDGGRLRGAVIDTFATEPLPGNHPFWRHPDVLVTPHMATYPDQALVASQVAGNLAALRVGNALVNRIDPRVGY